MRLLMRILFSVFGHRDAIYAHQKTKRNINDLLTWIVQALIKTTNQPQLHSLMRELGTLQLEIIELYAPH